MENTELPTGSSEQGDARPPPFDVPDMATDAAARFLNVKESTMHTWRSRGKGPAFYRVGKRVMYRRRDLEAFIASRRVVPAD